MTLWDKGPPKIPLCSICCWLCSLPLRVISFPSETPLEKTICKCLSVGDGFWVGDGSMLPFLRSALGLHLVQTHGGLRLVPQFLWFHVCVDHVDLEGLVSMVSSILTGSYTLSASSSVGPWEGGIWWQHPFGPECSKVFHSLHNIWLWVWIFVPICWKEEASLMIAE